MTAAEIREQVVASRRRQGLPDHVQDPATLTGLAAAVLATTDGAGDGRAPAHTEGLTSDARSAAR